MMRGYYIRYFDLASNSKFILLSGADEAWYTEIFSSLDNVYVKFLSQEYLFAIIIGF